MEFTLTEEQEMLKTTARDFLADKYPEEVRKFVPHHRALTLWAAKGLRPFGNPE